MIFEINEHGAKTIRDEHVKRLKSLRQRMEEIEGILGGSLHPEEVQDHVAELDKLKRECQASEDKIKEMDDHLNSLRHDT